MKNHFIALTLLLTAGPLAASLRAQETPTTDPNPNWFSIGPQFGLNISARFNHLGNVNPGMAGPDTGGGVNRAYDDGYVKVDSSGDAGGLTWNWGYQNAGQFKNGSLVMQSSSAAVNGSVDKDDDLQTGFDMACGRRLGALLGGHWGLQAAFDFTAYSTRTSQPLSGTGTIINDAYALNGVTPPPSPYSGSFSGSGALLGDSPTRTTASETILVTGSRSVDAQVYALRLGPYFEFPFGRGWSGRLGGGLALGVSDIKYTYNETIDFSGVGTINESGSGEGASFQAGGYLEGKLIYALTPCTSLFAGAQFESLGTFSQNAGNEQAQLDMSRSVFVLCGVQFNF
jgi:hypothetical protein